MVFATCQAVRIAPSLAKHAFAVSSLCIALTLPGHAQQSFASPEDAAHRLVEAAKSRGVRSLLAVLGRPASEIISSGDAVADADIRQRFISAYEEMHRLDRESNEKAILIIGKDDFPFPIPLILKNRKWQFDTTAGKYEVLARRIGRNELDAIQTCLAYVDAQEEYASKDRTGQGAGIYARQFVSDPGTTNGLYWPSKAGSEQSPLGELFARAAIEGYRVRGNPGSYTVYHYAVPSKGGYSIRQMRQPYRGYYYKILTEQGSTAPGGALNYVVDRRMIGGFALVAYPAEYRNSGVMSFIVNQDGVVYQKDLGVRTPIVARDMTEFNPDKSWVKVAP